MRVKFCGFKFDWISNKKCNDGLIKNAFKKKLI